MVMESTSGKMAVVTKENIDSIKSMVMAPTPTLMVVSTKENG